VRIQFENVDFSSRSGPNGFGLKLARHFISMGHELTNESSNVRLSFIQSRNDFSPTVLRLDGIYFNSAQNWEKMNEPILSSYRHADAVIVQSKFDQKLIETFFGSRKNLYVIHNGTDFDAIDRILPAEINVEREKVWMCASAWRPHKRLIDNVRLFQKLSQEDHIMLVAGRDSQQYLSEHNIVDDRIKILGDLSWPQLISCMKASKFFVHLSWLDHCPNVVIDARAAGCKIFCSSEGGTKEVAGLDASVVKEGTWKMMPTCLYEPPPISEFLLTQNQSFQPSINIRDVALKYESVLRKLVDETENNNQHA